MSSNDFGKTSKSNQLAKFDIALTLPFHITPVASRACLRYERDGHWNEKQKIKYIIFLKYFRSLFEDQAQRKRIRLYEMMSDMIITRNANQCRSHHQKMEKYRINISDIISSVVERYEPRVYQEMEQKYCVLIKGLIQNQHRYIRTQEPVRYYYTTYVPIICEKNAKKANTVKEESIILNIVAQPQKNQKDLNITNKDDRIKTADSYQHQRLQYQEDQNNDQTPIMDIIDNEPRQDDVPQPQGQKITTQRNDPQHLPEMNRFIGQEWTLLNEGGKIYYEQQIQIFKQKRQWHIQNVQHILSQIENQKQCIKNCETAIRYFQIALGVPSHTSTIN